MALLIEIFDPDIISIIGSWRRDEMIILLHVITCILMQGHITTMVSAGDYTLITVEPLISAVG